MGTFRRSCRRCGWSGTYSTPGLADFGKRKHSCELQIARNERTARGEARRAKWAALDRTPKPCLHKVANHEHGTNACYVLDKCRCPPCVQAESEYERNRTRLHAYGRWDNYVDAELARQHVRELMSQGMGIKRICVVGGASTGQLWKLLYGKKRDDGTRTPSKRVRKDVAERLLSIRLDLADGAKVEEADAIGVRRRLRALVALGWSQSKLATRLGVTLCNLGHLIHGGRGVTIGTQKAVERLYDELSMTLPPQADWRDKIAASRSRSYAKERGWQPPLALDDDALDDAAGYRRNVEDVAPTLDEQAIFRRMHGDKTVRLSTDEATELVRRWKASGRSLNEMQRHTGVNSHRYAEGEAS